MYDSYGFDDDDTPTGPQMIAWTVNEKSRGGPARYTKRHLALPGATKTLCGVVIPTEAFDFDPHASTDRCAKCAAKK